MAASWSRVDLLALSFVSGELAVVGTLDGVAKLRRCQVVLPLLCFGETTVFAGDRWVSPFSPQISFGVCVLVGDGSVGFSCFVSAKGCELPLIPHTGRWIPAVEVVPSGGKFLARKMSMLFQCYTCGSTVALGHWLLWLYV
ncbi:hypothetical protein PVAP13_3KG198927 [Panicum virgatum]|uniref:Secreted protein n=1 Tax=Panicum virgatum TaxID=38727 RepID=A0A8T0UR40_PANVG|nr:hypothetical protein PVAP13_3KG198927 [Panicum virgatum]